MIKKSFNDHNYDKLLKRCPFCNGKAILRSPTSMRPSSFYFCSDVSCTKCGVSKASEPCHRKTYKTLSREVQDKQVIKMWNTRK